MIKPGFTISGERGVGCFGAGAAVADHAFAGPLLFVLEVGVVLVLLLLTAARLRRRAERIAAIGHVVVVVVTMLLLDALGRACFKMQGNNFNFE